MIHKVIEKESKDTDKRETLLKEQLLERDQKIQQLQKHIEKLQSYIIPSKCNCHNYFNKYVHCV